MIYIKKILFILPYDNTYKYKTAFIPSISYQPLTLSTLAALVPENSSFDITLVDEGVQKFNYNDDNFDIVGISIVTSSSKRGYELADLFKTKGSYVLIGGHHATLMPDEALIHADTVFIGSAEITLPQFFNDYSNGSVRKLYQSPCVYADRVPVPRRDLMPAKGYLRQPTIIADYGCGNSCKYCVINSFWGKNAKRPISDVIDEIKMLGAKEYLFLDPSPLSDKAYAKELFYELSKMNIRWAGLSTLDVTDDDEILDLFAKSGCVGTLLGFESFNTYDLNNMSKYKNKVDKYKDVVEKLHNKRIVVLGTFMLGMDHDTVQSIRNMPDLIHETKIDIPRFAILTPFPNTAFYKRLDSESRILTKDWSLYDSIHCVFQPKNMSSHELENEFISLWKECYSIKRILSRLKYTPQRKFTSLVTNIGFNIYANNIEKLLGSKL